MIKEDSKVFLIILKTEKEARAWSEKHIQPIMKEDSNGSKGELYETLWW